MIDKKEKKEPKFRKDVSIEKRGTGKKYIVSSVVEGAPINWNFLKAMEIYAEKNNASVVLLWMRGVYKGDHFSTKEIDRIKKYLVSEFRFNSKLLAKDFMLHPAQKHPITGLGQYAQNTESLICASTKQDLKVIPRQRGKTPHSIHTTGTISVPNYSKTRIGCIAQQDNRLGALIVEIPDNTNFFIRQVQWYDSEFVDLGIRYTKSGCSSAECEAMILGDLHLGEEDPIALATTLDQIKTLKPKKIFIHDVASNNSINHHEAGNCIAKALRKGVSQTLEKEWIYVKDMLYKIRNFIPKSTSIYIVPSNHDDFILKWLKTGEFIKDPENAKIGAKLFLLVLDGKNPMAECLRVPGIRFIGKDEGVKVEGWVCSEHGHLGNNGSRGNIKSYINSFDKAFIGHSHTPQISGNIWQVGTLSKLTLPYTSGASSWMHANGVIYKNSHAQMLVFIGDQWHG